MKSINKLPLGSFIPNLFPAVEKGWQGGPPQIKNGSPTDKPVISNNCCGCISLISPPNTLCPLACIVFTQAASKSCPITTFKPAFPNPMSNPIAPENKEITSLLAAYIL